MVLTDGRQTKFHAYIIHAKFSVRNGPEQINIKAENKKRACKKYYYIA